MAPQNPRIRKPVGTIRQGRPTARSRQGWPVPPALVGAALFTAIGAGAWWLFQTPPALPEIAETAADVPATGPVPATQAEAASKVVVSAPPIAAPVPSPPAPATEPTDAPAEAAPKIKFEQLLVFDNLAAAKKENITWHEEAWQRAKTSGQWDDYRDLLGRSLDGFTPAQPDASAVVAGKFSGPALTRYAFLTVAPEAVLKPLMTDDETSDFIRWLLDTPEAMQAFTVQLTRADDVSKALKIWATIAGEHPLARTDYRELAIACALVFDRPVKAAGSPVDATTRYTYFQDNSEAGRLTGKIKKMPASDLIWVVGVPVSASELEWALKKADFRQKSWGQAYGTIKYDMEKAVTGKSPYTEYTFAEIQEKGGICSDQSYFTAWTACAHGIPAAIVSGDGARGAHAWITWLADEGEWKFSGRFSGYPAGRSRNPQSGESISEEEFVRLGDRKASSPEQTLKALQALWLANALAGNPDKELACITQAVKAAPRLPEPSAALLTYWTTHRAASPVEEWVGLLRDLRKDFRDSADLMEAANTAEEKFVFTRQETAATMKDLRREGRKVGDTASAGTGVAIDLARLTDGLRRQATVFAASKNTDGIRTIYRRALDEHGDDAATFKALAKDYFSFFKTDAEGAAKICRELESACRRSVGRGKGDWFDVTSQNSAWRVVAACYQSAGDASKAERIVKDCDSRESAAKKRAI